MRQSLLIVEKLIYLVHTFNCIFCKGQVKDATSEQIKHGGCLGLGLAAMGTHRADVYEQLKFCLYQVFDLCTVNIYLHPYRIVII